MSRFTCVPNAPSIFGKSRRGIFVFIAILFSFVPSFYAQSNAQAVPHATARVTAQVSDNVRTQLTGFAPFAQMASQDLGAISGSTELNHMILLLQPSQAQQQDLEQLLADQINPASPHFHQWLTPASFGDRFGVATEDITAVTTWLASHGLTVDEIPAGRRSIIFSGTATQLAEAFSTELHHYTVGTQTRVANASAPQIPSALAPVVSGLLSLNDSPRMANHRNLGVFQLDRGKGTVTQISSVTTQPTQELQAEGVTVDSSKIAPQFTTTIGTTTYHIVAPYDFATVYNLKQLWNAGIDGSGQTIAIVSRSDLNLSDVDKFRANFGLPASKVNKIYATATPGITADVEETALDVEWSGAVAKGATIDLVIAGSSLTSDGVDLSALYIVNNNIAPVLSMSYGACEFSIGVDGNNFYKTLWQQAAAQGQTVFVSSGDAGATTCDQGGIYSSLGLSVNGLGSTPYNVSVGGTDLYGTYSAPTTYWNASNDPATLSSALSYVPEVPWNDSCGNPVLLSILQAKKGYTDTSTAALCADSKVSTSNYRNIVGGGGGASNCLTSTDGTIATCTGGYPKPSWQIGKGVPNDGARDLPDVSLFAGDGLWGSFLPYCVSSVTATGICDLSSTTNIQGAGGTSFASPAFAGIMALINQKTASIQGNANPTFYKLAANQNSLDCTVESTSSTSGCIFHDVDLGANATPCYAYGKAKDCTTATTGAIWGVVNGYNAGKGYDPASGLGSVDITNLVNSWSSVTSALTATTTTLALGSTTADYGSGIAAKVSVAAKSGTPTGDYIVAANGLTGRQDSDPQGTLVNGSGTLTLSLLPVGSYPVQAHYAGDGTFASSYSAAQSITISKAATTTSVTASRTSLTSKQSSLLAITVSASGAGDAPSGNITVTNSATGSVLGTYALTQSPTSVSSSINVDIYGTQLVAGVNTLTLSYAGDSNYVASVATVDLSFAAPFAASLSSNTLTLTTTSSAVAASTTLALAPASGSTLAYPIALSCTGTLPVGASCSVSSAVLSSPTTSATVTLSYSPVIAANTEPSSPGSNSRIPVATFAGVILMVAVFRRRRPVALLGLLVMTALPLAGLLGCSGSSSPGSILTLTSSTTSTTLGSSVTFNTLLIGTNSSSAINGNVVLNDNYHGSARTLGTVAVSANGTASLTLSTLGIGNHSIIAIYGGSGAFSGTTSSTPANVSVASVASLTVMATDANGYSVALPLGVKLQ